MRASVMLRAAACVLAIAAAAILSLSTSQAQNAPRYVADVNWPKPLPERWCWAGSAASAWTRRTTC